MSIVKTIGKGVTWNATSVIIGKVVIFANVFLILRYLSVYEYGLGQLVLSVVSMLGIFLLPGLASTIVADLAAERIRGEFGKMKSIFFQFSSLNLALAFFAWAVLFFGSDIAAHLSGNDTVGYLLKISSFSLLITPFRTIATTLAAVELRYFDQSFYGLVEEVAKLFCLVIFLLVLHSGLSGFLYAIIISQCVAVLVFVRRSISAYEVFGHAQAEDPHAFWRMIHEHRKWSIFSSYVGSLGQNLNLWIIKFLLGTEAVGLFAFAQGIYSQVASFLPLGSVLVPLLPRYANQRDVFARYVRSAIKAQCLLSFPLIAATFIGLPVLIYIFPKYQPAVPLIEIIIFSLIPASVGNLYVTAFTALKEQYMFFYSTMWKIAFIAVLTPLAISVWGIWGIAIGAVLISFASAVERSLRMKRVLPEFTFTARDIITFDAYERMLFNDMWERWRGMLTSLRRRV